MAVAPESFGRYRVTGTLGKGAMGEVYLAVDEVLGREVAVKTLRGGVQGLAARLLDERFRQEARAIASLAHPGVVQVFDIDVKAEPPYIVMERVTGPSLKEILGERALSDRELRALGIQIANALAAAHAAGIVHRDVKPANILYAAGGRPAGAPAAGEGAWKLADFGVAHVPDSALTMTGQFVGSPAYAPPEALLRGQLGPAGDIYGLGATLYQAIAGRWPRSDSTSGALLAPVPPLRELAPNVSSQVADAIDRAVAMEPEQRPNATDFAAALARAATPIPTRARSPAPVHENTELVASLPGPSLPPGPSTPPDTSMPPGTSMPPTPPMHAGSMPSTPVPEVTTYVASHAGVPSPPPAKRSWQRYALIAATLAVIIIIAITRQSPSPPAAGNNARPPDFSNIGPPRPQSPQTIRADQPPIHDHKAAKDWNKIVDKLHEGKFGEARDKLEDFERKHGESPETRSLASQLDALPAEVYVRHDED